jgi:hypothetical protein
MENEVKCSFINFHGNFYQHDPGYMHPISKAAQQIQRAAVFFPLLPVRFLCRLGFFALRMFVLALILGFYDGCIFIGGESIFSLRELWLYRLAGKKLVFIFLGSDGRPLFLNGAVASKARGISPEECYKRSKQQKQRIRRIERFADVVVSHPTASQFLEKPFIPFLKIGMPCLPDSRTARTDCRKDSGLVRIVHAPTFPECKGTDLIRKLIAEMMEAGGSIEYIELVGKPNSMVLQELACCDFVIDEVYSDTCLAGLATEAAFFAKPSVVGSYADYQCMGLEEMDMKPPSLLVHPDLLRDAVVAMVRETGLRTALGDAARDFVKGEWTPKKVPSRLLKLMAGKFPARWFFDPRGIGYFHGWGFPIHKHRAYLREILKRHSIHSIGISDKPHLVNAISRFCE